MSENKTLKLSTDWWNEFDYSIKAKLTGLHYGEKRIVGSLTKSDIQYIYLKEKDNIHENPKVKLYTLQSPLVISNLGSGKWVNDGIVGENRNNEFTSKQVAEELYSALMDMWAEFNTAKGNTYAKAAVAKAQDLLDKYAKK